jgi:ribonuclease G
MAEGPVDILVEVSPGEIRVALAGRADGRLVELHVERMGDASLVDGIYRGRVRKVERSLGGAFVDFGVGVDGFLRQGEKQADQLHEGQAVTVQVTRDGGGGKGPALTSRVTLHGRYLHWRPGSPGVAYSPRLGNGRRRAHVEALVPGLLRSGEGVAVRAAAALVGDTELAKEANRLREAWNALADRERNAEAPVELVEPPGLVHRVLRDGDAGEVIIDDRQVLRAAAALAEAVMPDRRLHLHSGQESLFEAHGVAAEVDGVCDRVLTLPGGGRLTFDSTEAMTVIDVDSGSADGRGPSEAAAQKINHAVLPELARQVRLRNLSGLIVVDFISMRRRGARTQLLKVARQAFRDDPQQVDVLDMTVAGLVELTRRRAAPPLHEVLMRRKPVGESPDAAACALLRAALRLKGPGVPAATAPGEVLALLAEGRFAPALAEVERRLGQRLEFHSGGDGDGWAVAMHPRPRV